MVHSLHTYGHKDFVVDAEQEMEVDVCVLLQPTGVEDDMVGDGLQLLGT